MKINYIIEKSYDDRHKHIWTYVDSFDDEKAAIKEYDDYVERFPNVDFRLVNQTIKILKATRL